MSPFRFEAMGEASMDGRLNNRPGASRQRFPGRLLAILMRPAFAQRSSVERRHANAPHNENSISVHGVGLHCSPEHPFSVAIILMSLSVGE